jgi:hypothetical protein
LAVEPEPNQRLTSGGRALGAQHMSEVEAFARKQTAEDSSVGREPQAVAIAAKRLRDAGDETNLSRAIGIAVALGRFSAVVGRDGFEIGIASQLFKNFGGADDLASLPVVEGIR